MTTRRELITGGLAAALFPQVCLSSPVKSMLGAGEPLREGEIWMPTAEDYVQDGLEVLFDGIENCGYGVEDPEATIWTDCISGKRVANCFFQEGCCIFTKSQQAGKNCAIMDQFTCEVRVARVAGTNPIHSVTILQYWLNGAGNYGTYGFTAQRYPNNSIQYIGGMAPQIATSNAPEEFHTLAATFSFGDEVGTANYYVDGELVGTRQRANDLESYASTWNTYFNFYPNNMLCRVSKYDRVLSPDEIAYNHELDRLRFNLP